MAAKTWLFRLIINETLLKIKKIEVRLSWAKKNSQKKKKYFRRLTLRVNEIAMESFWNFRLHYSRKNWRRQHRYYEKLVCNLYITVVMANYVKTNKNNQHLGQSWYRNWCLLRIIKKNLTEYIMNQFLYHNWCFLQITEKFKPSP